MTLKVKICGLRDAVGVAAAVESGADFLDFVFYPPSLRAVDAQTAECLVRVLPHVPFRMIQLHGTELPLRVAEVKSITGFPVIKAVGIADRADVEFAQSYESVADYLQCDAKSAAMSGGNGAVFDWSLLKSADFARPWFLAGEG